MVAAHDRGVDIGGDDARHETLRDQEVVDAPAHVSLAGLGEVGPPGVKAVALVKESKGVDEPRVEVVLKPLSLLGGVAGLADVGLGIRQVIGGVRDVEVAAEHHRFARLEFLEVM